MNKKLIICSLVSVFWIANFQASIGQCETWNNNPKKDKAEGAHSIYRQALKTDNYKMAFENWQVAYNIAPAADGKRDFHYMDGIKLYKWKFDNTEDKAKQQVYRDSIMLLYDQAAECYQQQAIDLQKCNGQQSCYDAKAGYVLGRKAYDMYYTYNMPRKEIYNTVKKSIELAGNESEYIVFDPMAASIVYLYEKEQITADEARNAHQSIIKIGEYNIENNERYSEYYDQSLTSVSNKVSAIENALYDCQYFIDNLLPEYRANPENDTILERVFVKLTQKGCDSTLPVMQELKAKYTTYIEEYNRTIQKELAEKNPAYAAKLLYDEGKYDDAILKYKEALVNEDATEKQADIYFRMASILGRKLNQYSQARNYARKAAELNPGWGRPYLLIGDLYASSDCGDSWNKRLAILAALDKYAYAKSIDPEVAQEANRRMATYSGSKPLQQDAFMRGKSEGDRVKVGCWIGETVSLRFSKG